MKTISKLCLLCCLVFHITTIFSQNLPPTPTLSTTRVLICLPDSETIYVTDSVKFKTYLWEIALMGSNNWMDVTDFDSLLFPINDQPSLLIPGDISITNHKVVCIASVTDLISNGASSAEVPITISDSIHGNGTINGQDKCCSGPVTLFYKVEGLSNVDTYEWEVPSWATITYISDLEDEITISGTAPPSGQDTAISVTPINEACGNGQKIVKLLKVFGQVSDTGYVTGPDFLCLGSEATYVLHDITNATRSRWIVPAWTTIVSSLPDSSQITLVANEYGSGKIRIIPFNPCDQGDTIIRHVNVYSELNPGLISSDTSICYHSTPEPLHFIEFPAGAGGGFTLQWQESSNLQWNDITGEIGLTYSPPVLDADHYYRVKVYAPACDETKYTNSTLIQVYGPVNPGTIGNDQQSCEGAQPDPLTINVSPAGGSGKYFYQWISSGDLISWEVIENAKEDSYQPPVLEINTHYRLIVIDSAGCGSDTTNIASIQISPKPENANVLGSDQVCRNSFDSEYNVDPLRPGYLYAWSLQSNLGTFQTGQYTNRTYIHWGNTAGQDVLILKQLIASTLCESLTSFPVEILSEQAPNQTTIVRKPNSNILICADTSENIKYQWGYIPRPDGSPTEIPDGTLQYVLLPHEFDSSASGYYYYVDTYFEFGGGITCSTRSFMNHYELPIGMDDEVAVNEQFRIYPNPATGIINIEIPSKYLHTKLNISLFDLTGRRCLYDELKSSQHLILTLPSELYSGIYLLKITTSESLLNATRLIIL
jgi:hypothetical protein